jgi:hypothetical protein
MSPDESTLITVHPHEFGYVGEGGIGNHLIASAPDGSHALNINLENCVYEHSLEYDSAKTHAPKYKYWVLRVPVSIPEYTS